MAGPVDVEWSVDALADLQRFSTFLHDQYPAIAVRVASELMLRTDLLRRHPQMGRPIGGSHGYREIVLVVRGGTYALQYRYDGRAVLVLRLFHSRELRQ